MTTKRCTTCDTIKPFSDFYKDKARPDGLYSRCKACHRAATDAWRKRNNESVNRAARERRAADPERAREIANRQKKKAYDRDPEKFRARSKVNYEASKADQLAYHKEYRAKNVEKRRGYAKAYYAKNSAKLKAASALRGKEKREELRPYNAER